VFSYHFVKAKTNIKKCIISCLVCPDQNLEIKGNTVKVIEINSQEIQADMTD
jgi:hypothetical protein